MGNNKYVIVYFTGTGGTQRVAQALALALGGLGQEISLCTLKQVTLEGLAPKFLIMCYPVYAGNPPHPVMNWLQTLPKAEDSYAWLVAVSGGGAITPNLASTWWPRRVLTGKGYRVLADDMVAMASNIFVSTKPQVVQRLLEVLPRWAEFFASVIVDKRPLRVRFGFGNATLSLLGRLEGIGAWWFGRGLEVKEPCTSCGWCVRHCPVENITMGEKGIRFGSGCAFCLGCVYGCPEGAIVPRHLRGFVLPQVHAPYTRLLDTPRPDPSLEKDLSGLWWLGVRRYLRRFKGIGDKV